MRATFKKAEKLSSKKALEQLFSEGKKFSIYPFRVIHFIQELEEKSSSHPAQVMISVPKKKFKNATDRNRIKRQISAAYRINKSLLYTHLNHPYKRVTFAIIYNSYKVECYAQIEAKIILSLQRLANIYGQTNELDINSNN